jgi:hypothetical protein
MQTHR